MDCLSNNLSALALVCTPLLLVVACFVLTVETGVVAGVLLPGSSTVLLVGALVGSGRLPFVPSMTVLVLASTLGAQLGFAASRRQSTRNRAPRFVCMPKRTNLVRVRAQRVFEINAAAGTVLAHMVGGARTLGPRLAAGSALSFRRFAVLNTTAAILWVNTLLRMGAYVGTDSGIVPWLLVASACVLVVVGVVRLRQRQNRDHLRVVPLDDIGVATRLYTPE